MALQCMFVLTAAFCGAAGGASGSPLQRGETVFEPLAKGTLRFGGETGTRLNRLVDQWLLPAPEANPAMLEMFHLRDRQPTPNLVDWAGEFVGKYLISAIQCRRMVESPALDARIRQTLEDLYEAQAPDGYLGPWPREQRLLGHWDLWGHYHIMLALIMWYEDTGEARALDAAEAMASLVCETYPEGGRRPIEAGWDEMNLSILHGLGRLYEHRPEPRYLALMHRIVEDFATPPAGDYFRQGLAGKPFYEMPKPRWESLHAIQGLLSLHEITGEPGYRTAFENIWRSILAHDIHNTGAFSTNEAAVGSPFRRGAIETCCHVAWMFMTVDMLRVTGDSAAADALEHGYWNGGLGALHPSGRWCTYQTPSNGKREASAHTIVFQARPGAPELNCCSVNGPRLMGMLSEWGIMRSRDGGVVVNFHGPMEASIPLAAGGMLELRQNTAYPADGTIEIEIGLAEPERFSLLLRIPAWAEGARIAVNGNELDMPEPGTYARVDQGWRDGDRVRIELPMTPRTWLGDEDELGNLSLYRGPLLLAFDQKYNDLDVQDVTPLDYARLEWEAVEEVPNEALVLLGLRAANGAVLRLCDFASAGTSGTEYASWLPVENAPPPAFRTLEPAPDSALPTGPAVFTWTGSRKPGYAYHLEIARDRTFETVVHRADTAAPRAIVANALNEPGRYFWRVTSQSGTGQRLADNAPAAFEVDCALSNPLAENPARVFAREDGLVLGVPLRGAPEPVYGHLDKAWGLAPAQGPDGQEEGAVCFRGPGMARYATHALPRTDYTLMVWVKLMENEGEPGRIRQIASAWHGPLDDPIRLCVADGRVYARVEAETHYQAGPGAALPVNTWNHLAMVKSGPRLLLYVNGEEMAEGPVPAELGQSRAQTIALGANPNYHGGEYLDGCLSRFMLYNRVLHPDEIAAHRETGLVE